VWTERISSKEEVGRFADTWLNCKAAASTLRRKLLCIVNLKV
jgi:hypothetical protein